MSISRSTTACAATTTTCASRCSGNHAATPLPTATSSKGLLALHEDFVHEGILGTTFLGRLVEETRVGTHPAVVAMLTGQAWITGFSNYVLDESDPFPEGF